MTLVEAGLKLSDLAIFNSSYGYCDGDPEFDERANLEEHRAVAHVFRGQ